MKPTRCPACRSDDVETTTLGTLGDDGWDRVNTSTCGRCGLRGRTWDFQIAAATDVVMSADEDGALVATVTVPVHEVP